MTNRHIFPTRRGVIQLIREFGMRSIYPNSELDATQMTALLEGLTDGEYATRAGCDHHDEHGDCLGHDDEASA